MEMDGYNDHENDEEDNMQDNYTDDCFDKRKAVSFIDHESKRNVQDT